MRVGRARHRDRRPIARPDPRYGTRRIGPRHRTRLRHRLRTAHFPARLRKRRFPPRHRGSRSRACSVLCPGRSVVASQAAGLPGPIDGPTLTSADDALADALTVTRTMGMSGKLCMHPGQAPVINRALSPTDTDIDWARQIIDQLGVDGARIENGSDLTKLGRARTISRLATVFAPAPNGRRGRSRLRHRRGAAHRPGGRSLVCAGDPCVAAITDTHLPMYRHGRGHSAAVREVGVLRARQPGSSTSSCSTDRSRR